MFEGRVISLAVLMGSCQGIVPSAEGWIVSLMHNVMCDGQERTPTFLRELGTGAGDSSNARACGWWPSARRTSSTAGRVPETQPQSQFAIRATACTTLRVAKLQQGWLRGNSHMTCVQAHPAQKQMVDAVLDLLKLDMREADVESVLAHEPHSSLASATMPSRITFWSVVRSSTLAPLGPALSSHHVPIAQKSF